MSAAEVLRRLVALGPVWPILALWVLGGALLWFERVSERFAARLTLLAVSLSVLSGSCALALWLTGGDTTLGPVRWFGFRDYGFALSLHLDGATAAVLLMAVMICLAIARFSINYLHREPGFGRFMLLLLLFCGGVQLLVAGASVDTLFIGWEMVGLSSVLLVAFFRDRAAPVRAGLRVLTTYRLADVGLLLGGMLLHHYAGSTDFAAIAPAALPTGVATGLALLFLIAAMGKSAQFPLGGWLPRAMEGPTPSSALFYGAISIHMGAWLLLRLAPLLAQAPVARAVVVVIGLTTAAYGAFVGRVQSDIKGTLAFAAMAQVGLIFAEVGLGLHRLALLHLLGHAMLRCWQLLRAPSVLRDHQELAAAHDGLPPRGRPRLESLLPEGMRVRFYDLALERLHLDAVQDRWMMRPLMVLGAWLGRIDRWILGAVEDRGSGR